jgi:hypothetical protein
MARTASKQLFRFDLRAVVYKHGEWWIAHCLELDLVAEGRDPQSALKDLMEISSTQLETVLEAGDLESAFRPAPPGIWAMFARAADLLPRRRPRRPINRFEAREAVLV